MPRNANPAPSSPNPLEDLKLVRGLLQGQPSQERTFLDRMKCVPRILAATNNRLGRPVHSQDFPDMLQDVLVVIWKKLPQFQGRASLETWIYRICCLELMNVVRKKGVRGTPFELTEAELATPENPSPEVEAKDLENLYRGLERLEPEEARIVRLKHFDELTFREIGERLDLSSNTAKTKYYRALKRLWHILRHPSEEEK